MLYQPRYSCRQMGVWWQRPVKDNTGFCQALYFKLIFSLLVILKCHWCTVEAEETENLRLNNSLEGVEMPCNCMLDRKTESHQSFLWHRFLPPLFTPAFCVLFIRTVCQWALLEAAFCIGNLSVWAGVWIYQTHQHRPMFESWTLGYHKGHIFSIL